ncbi:MAG: ligand-binding protein SH3 [Gammaproteobacteria bacterium]|nr:ligand-binding protein SH3 [Gammaproteobacteria bacterium]MBT5644455.1 ligand-binding protein SH3 [Gammaproteobacteria bacterium]MBT5863605.1 ligand-binding protein SH3 [Gammaproteobacteria bacterium]MBT6734010.1 ligand-binding protein SH3 [Gammaproteobacteria bacterium]MBT7236059.1 ligand-binding protein SH3 [Gammaproteobacteria bacterium]|tara:strand:- start:361 stop:804 length:444 start_codon:yes stop_codon:yes gene_type:complete
MSLINNFPHDGIVTINRVILKDEFTLDDLQERVAVMCENVKTYHSETGFIGGMVVLNSGQISNEGSNIGKALASDLKDREALIITFWTSYEDHENSHKSETFQPLFQKVIDVCENGNEEIVYSMLWQGAAYTPEMAKLARTAKKKNK